MEMAREGPLVETPATTMLDRWGYPVRTASGECIEAINAYYEQVLSYGRHRTVILRAAIADPDCVLANVLAGHFTSSRKPSVAASHLASAAASLDNATAYERAVFRSVSCMVASKEKDEEEALVRHFELLREFPKDLSSLKRAQILTFYMGRPDLSLNLVEQVLAFNEGENYIFGMLAFPLLELGRMSEAEKAAKKGLEINRCDAWSQHNVCHVYQYEYRFKEAVEFMEACSSTWLPCSSFMYTHNWWHVAICYLEGDCLIDKVLELYDNHIWKELERTDAEPGEVYINALGLLLHLDLREVSNIESRLLSAVKAFMTNGTWHIEWFLDILALWALSRSKEIHTAEDLLKSMNSRFKLMSKNKQLRMQRAILLAEAMFEFGKANYEKVFDLLGPDFNVTDFKMIGVSDEQIDVFNYVWYVVLLRIEENTKAVEEIKKGLDKRPGIPFLWRLLEKAYSADGRRTDALQAAEKAKDLQSYF